MSAVGLAPPLGLGELLEPLPGDLREPQHQQGSGRPRGAVSSSPVPRRDPLALVTVRGGLGIPPTALERLPARRLRQSRAS